MLKYSVGNPALLSVKKSDDLKKFFGKLYRNTYRRRNVSDWSRIQIGYGIKNNVYDYDNEEDSFVKDIANYIQEMDHLLSKLCDLKELDQKARHIDIEQLLERCYSIRKDSSW